jgi:asparagine synthase (glutamine-hydrolysing)
MCGICGERRFDGQAPDKAAVGRMMAALARRGPDDEGCWADGPLAFGHRRLSIIDLSAHAHQPMVDPVLGLAIVFNGTIYNYRALRDELIHLGYSFFSTGDTEVILKAYHAWGEGCVERLNGMFAFAIWDPRTQGVFLARDRLGVKPLYYSFDGARLRFASTLPALLAGGGIDRAVDPVALHHQLTLHAVVPAPLTILKGVRKLAPATTLTFAPNGKMKERRYWQLYAGRPPLAMSDEEWIGETRAAFLRAVARQFDAADTPVGVLLSGGLDSSLLVAALAEHGARDLATFSIGFEAFAGEAADEFEYSDAVVARFGTRHHRYVLPNDNILETLPDAVAAMSEPMVSQDVVAFYLLAERVKREVKVVQSGQGADEAFGGYFWYPQMEAETGADLDRFRRHYFDRPHADFLAAVTEPYRGADFTSDYVRAQLAPQHGATFLDRVLRFDVTTLVVDDPVKRVDNMTMAWGLEARVPFLDHELVELAARMPPAFRLRDGGKYPLKKIARGWLPDSVIDRPKGYFPVPVLKYVRGPFLDFMRGILTSDACRRRNVFERSHIDALLAAPESHMTPIGGSLLRHAAMLELWCQKVVD